MNKSTLLLLVTYSKYEKAYKIFLLSLFSIFIHFIFEKVTQTKTYTQVKFYTHLPSHHIILYTMMNIDTSTFKNKDAVVVQHINHPPPPPPILARQQSDESYTPLPLSLSLAQPIVVVVKKKKQGQEEELPRTTPTSMSSSSSSLSLSSLSLKDNIDKVLHILKDDDDDDGSNRKRKQTASPTSTMDKSIYKKRTECFDLHPFSFTTTSYDGNDDNDSTSRSFSSILVSKRREKHHHHVVRFNPYVQIKETISHQDYTSQERYNTYLQHEEFQLMKQREYLLQSKMESLVKQSYKLASYQEVFLEQERQEEDQEYDSEYYEYGNSSQSSSSSEYYPSSYHCIYDDQAIANAYSKISLDCRSRAKQVALENRQEIEIYLHDSLS